MTLLYALLHPVTREMRYIGKTDKSLEARLVSHLKDARSSRGSSYRKSWIKSLLGEGLTPLIELLDEAQDGDAAEIAFIGIARALGCRLVNYAPGGKGVTQHSEATKRKISFANKGRKHDALTRLKVSMAGIGRAHSDTHKQRIAAAHKGKKRGPEARQHMRQGRAVARLFRMSIEEIARNYVGGV